MKRIICGLVAVVLLLGVVLGCTPAAPAGPIVLKAVSWMPLGRTLTNHVETVYLDMVKERSNGQLIIDLIGGPEVIPIEEQGDACAQGSIDFVIGVARHAHIVPEMYGYGCVGISPWEQREKGIHKYMMEAHEKANIMYLGKYSGGDNYYWVMYLKEPVSKLEDLRGLKIDGMGNYEKFIEEIGGVPVAIGGAGIYTAMERGLLDGFVWSNVGTFPGWEELSKTIIDHSMGPCHTFLLLMNLDKFEALPKHLRDVLTEVSAEYEYLCVDYYEGLVGKTRAQWEAAGAQYIKLPLDEGKRYSEAARQAQWELAAGLMGPELAAEFEKKVMSKLD